MIWRLFAKTTTVKPLTLDADTQWGVFTGRAYQSLWDDLRRYGWRVFLHNLRVTLGLVSPWLSNASRDVEYYD